MARTYEAMEKSAKEKGAPHEEIPVKDLGPGEAAGAAEPAERVAAPVTPRVDERVVAPVTPRVDERVVAPVTPRVPPRVVAPEPTVKVLVPVTEVLPFRETPPVPVEKEPDPD